jgi:hypothetical protein
VNAPAQGLIRLSIEGIPQPEEVAATTAFEAVANTHGYNFVTDPLAPGLHVARIQWEVSGGRFCIRDRSLIVLHK